MSSVFAHGLLPLSGVLITDSRWGTAVLSGGTGKLEDVFKTVLSTVQL